MKKPTDNPRRPARPERRFSVMRGPVRQPGAPDTPAADPEGEQIDQTAPVDAPAADTSAPVLAREAVRTADRAGSAPQPIVAPRSADEARVAKVMARAGLCSRREAESWILAGRVALNGTVIDSPALNIGPADQITVDGYPIDKPEHTRLFMFHKTRGLVTTARDPEARPTIYDALPEHLPRLVTIGRLDINTEGLLLLTNDGGLARLLELPSTGWLRRYRVRANGRVDQTQLDALAKGVTVEGVNYAGIDAKLDRIQGANLWLTLGLREGKNREVKRVLDHLGLAVTRLIRISFGPFQLGDLAENAVEEVRTRVLRDQLGSALAKQAGLDLRTEQADPAPAAPPVAEPRRKTSRSATADRKGRAVAVERITRAEQPRPERSPSDRPVPAGRVSRRERTPSPAGGPPPARVRDGAERSDARPARTLRQSDATARFREEEPRSSRPSREGRDDRPGNRMQRSGPASRGEPARFKGKTRDTERPRTGRNKEEFGSRRGSSRPPGPGRADPGRADQGSRPDRREGRGGDLQGAQRLARTGRGDATVPARPGKAPSRSGGDRRPDRPGKPSGGGGRGRPRS